MFQTPLRLEATTADRWRVIAPLVWDDPSFGRIIVPEGLETDLASIPRALRDWRVFDVNGPSRRPAVAHDFLYADGRQGKPYADRFLRTALIAEGLSRSAAGAYYLAVRWFGDAAWNSHRARNPLT